MASGHVNRANRPNTWLLRPMLQTVKKALANPEPSTHGPEADSQQGQYRCALRWERAASGGSNLTLCASASLAFLESRPWTVRPNYGKSASPHASPMVRLAFVAAHCRAHALGVGAGRIAQGEPLRTRGRLLSLGR
jgi:hypothetical protein